MRRSHDHRFAQRIAALAVLAAFAAPTAANGEEQKAATGLGVLLKSGAPAGASTAPQLSLTIPAEAPASASASALLLLENTSGEKIAGLKILGYLFPEAGQAVAAPAISIKVAGADMPATGWSLEVGKTLPVTLTVSNVDASAPFEGWLVGVRGEGEYGVLARVKVERLGAQLKFLGTAADGATKLDLAINTLSWRLTAESTGAAPFDLDVITTPLLGPNGVRVAPVVRVSGRGSAVNASKERPAYEGVVHARVSGPGLIYVDLNSEDLVAAGTYTGSVELRPAKGASAIARLTITRTRGAPPVEFKPPDPVHDVTFTPGRSTEVRVALKETSGQTVALDRPALAMLARKDGAGKLQAAAVVDQVRDAFGNPVEFPLVLPPGAIRLLSVQLSPITVPGEYTGTLQFGSANYAVLEQPVTVMKKHSAWIAAAVILSGIVLSFLQRTYYSRTLPRKLQVRDASKLSLQLRDALRAFPPLTDPEPAASASLADELKTIRASADGKDATRARLALASEKLKLFILEVPARVLLDSVRPQSDADPYRDRLSEALGLVTSPDATIKLIQDSGVKIRAIPTELFGTAKTGLQTQITAFAKEVGKQIDDLTIAPKLRDALKAQVAIPLNDSADRLSLARDLSGVATARGEFEAARGKYATVLSGQLKRLLAGAPLPGFTPQEWSRLDWGVVGPDLADAVKLAETDPASAIASYNRAFARYIFEAATALSKKAKERSQVPVEETPEAKAVREAEKPQYDRIIADLDAVCRNVSPDNTRDAAVAYQKALDAYRALNPVVLAMGAPGGRVTASNSLSTAEGAADPAGGADSLRPVEVDPATEVADIDRWVSATQKVVLLLTLIFGTLTGLQTLWANDPTWGGWGTLAAAFVWGAGLQQIAGLTADQLMDALDRTVT
jgi:hypothetical protein